MDFYPDRKKFRINPMEIAIFAVATLILVKSSITFFSDRGLAPVALETMAANPTSEGRAPATSATRSFADMDLACNGTQDQQTTASKIRVRGSFCGGEIGADGKGLLRTLVVNQSNHSTATVFTDIDQGKFSTDYIPLNSGKNLIHVEFSYANGKTVTREFSVTKQ